MKTLHVVSRAPKLPQPGKTYGARVGGLRLGKASVTVEWEVFSHKPRKVRGAKK